MVFRRSTRSFHGPGKIIWQRWQKFGRRRESPPADRMPQVRWLARRIRSTHTTPTISSTHAVRVALRPHDELINS